jgi:hypothetical protein
VKQAESTAALSIADIDPFLTPRFYSMAWISIT